MPVEPFIGQLMPTPYDFAPAHWAVCEGQFLQVAEHPGLFALLGTTFGGDGTTTFALPDLRGRVPISSGLAPGQESYNLGQSGGTPAVTLTAAEMPRHTHSLSASASPSVPSPGGNFPAPSATGAYQTASDGSKMSAQMLSPAGGSQPHENLQPYTVINWLIALEGVFPDHP